MKIGSLVAAAAVLGSQVAWVSASVESSSSSSSSSSSYAEQDTEWSDPRLTLEDFEDKTLASGVRCIAGAFGVLGITPDSNYYTPPMTAGRALYIYIRNFMKPASPKDLIDRDGDAGAEGGVDLTAIDGGSGRTGTGKLGEDGTEGGDGASPYEYNEVPLTGGEPNSVLYTGDSERILDYIKHNLNGVNSVNMTVSIVRDGNPLNAHSKARVPAGTLMKFDKNKDDTPLIEMEEVKYGTEQEIESNIENIIAPQVSAQLKPFFIVRATGTNAYNTGKYIFNVMYEAYSITLNELGGYFFDAVKKALMQVGKNEFRMAGVYFNFNPKAAPDYKKSLKSKVADKFCSLIVQGRAHAIADGVYAVLIGNRNPLAAGALGGISNFLPLSAGTNKLMGHRLIDYRAEFYGIVNALKYAINEYISREDVDVNSINHILLDSIVTELINVTETYLLRRLTIEEPISYLEMPLPFLNEPTDLSHSMSNEPFNEFLTALGCRALSVNGDAAAVTVNGVPESESEESEESIYDLSPTGEDYKAIAAPKAAAWHGIVKAAIQRVIKLTTKAEATNLYDDDIATKIKGRIGSTTAIAGLIKYIPEVPRPEPESESEQESESEVG
ncbi:MAG: hypothetical protein LBG13_00930 [Holosporales bacterium]|jgi:hypothetical protein|nr:hypothetical protein [Holosporales bacterium]